MMAEKWWEYAKSTTVYDELIEKYNKSVEPKLKNKLLSKIFNIKNEYRNRDKWKVLTLLGLKIKFRLIKSEKVFVIFNTAYIGDILLNNALVQNIRYFYPQSRIVFVVQPQFKDVALYQRNVTDVITFDKKHDSNLFGFINFIRKFPYKNIFASFVIYSNERNLILAKLLGSKHIITEPAGFLSKIIPTKEKYPRNKYTHKKDISTGLIEPLTGRCFLDMPIKYDVPELDNALIKNIKNLASERDLVGICATTKFAPKDMPIDVTKKLIELINNSGKTPVLFGAGKVAKDYSDNLKNSGCDDFIDLVDKTSFTELANILKICKKTISVDTGTMHFANAVNCPTAAVFYETYAQDCWQPQENLYKAVTITAPKNANDIYEKLNELN